MLSLKGNELEVGEAVLAMMRGDSAEDIPQMGEEVRLGSALAEGRGEEAIYDRVVSHNCSLFCEF